MAISDKLNYLIETKQLFKDRLNSLGAEIVESTTFRNYLSWLDNFFEKASDKTDLANNGIVGSTEQNGTPTPTNPIEIKNKSGELSYKVGGKNLLHLTDGTYTNSGITAIVENGKITLNGTATANSFISIPLQSNLILNGGINYSFSANNKVSLGEGKSGNYACMRLRIIGVSDDTSTDVLFNITDNSTLINKTSDTTYATFRIRTADTLVYNNYTIYPQLEESSTATDYEPYIEPRTFPLNLKSKNLFDKDNISNNEWLLANGTTESHNDFCVSDYIPIKENTDYYLPMTNTRRLKYYDSEKQPLATNDWDIARSTVGQVITTPNNANYVRITIHTAVVDINTFQFEESSTPTDYEPYYDIELCEIGSYKDKIYSQNEKFYLDKFTGKVVLNGSEDWLYYTDTNKPVFFIDTTRLMQKIDYLQESGLICYSNYYQGKGQVSSFDNVYDLGNNVITFRITYKRLVIRNDNITNNTDLKTWLSTHNTEVEYALATPTNEEIAEENYPTLYKQLKDILDYLTQYKINNEFLLDYSSPEIEY